MQKNLIQDHPEAATHLVERQIVALQLGGEVYGVDIAVINTVIVLQEITPVPRTPAYIKGVMNLRGQIVPVVDLKMRLEMSSVAAHTEQSSRIVIVDFEGIKAGLIVDAVSEVITLSSNMIEPPSSLIASKDCEFITGIGRIEKTDGKGNPTERLILLLDLVKVLTPSVTDHKKLKALNKAA